MQHHYNDRCELNHSDHIASIRPLNRYSWKLGWNLLAGSSFLVQIAKANKDKKGVRSLPEPFRYNAEEILLVYEVLKYI